MRFDQSDHVENEDLLDLTSMVDVVFILLTFFVMTSRFMPHQLDAVLGSAPPMAQAGASEQDLPEAVIVRVLANAADQPPRLAVGQMRLPAGQYGAITAKLREIDVPRLPVVIAADPEVSVDEVAQVLDAVMKSPMQRISLTEIQEGGPSSVE